jgi:transposase
MGRHVKSIGWTMKNASRVVDYNHDNQNVKSFCESYNQAVNGNLICIDEAGFYIGDHQRRGWSKRGTKLKIQCGKSLRRSKLTLIMAVSANGIVHHEVLDHNCKKVDFIAFIERLAAPIGSSLLMDNIAFHHSKETQAAMEKKGFVPLFIPPYSPKLNSIENVFGMLKPMYRRQCPPSINAAFDYRALFESIVASLKSRGLEAFFSKTQNVVRSTLLSIEADRAGFRFCGYD